jgi:hypothetical protein
VTESCCLLSQPPSSLEVHPALRFRLPHLDPVLDLVAVVQVYRFPAYSHWKFVQDDPEASVAEGQADCVLVLVVAVAACRSLVGWARAGCNST